MTACCPIVQAPSRDPSHGRHGVAAPRQCRIQGSFLARTSAYCRLDTSRLAPLCLVLTEESGRTRLRELEGCGCTPNQARVQSLAIWNGQLPCMLFGISNIDTVGPLTRLLLTYTNHEMYVNFVIKQ